MRTISIINQKGGCGKTTTAINLSACLARAGKRVLLVDMDPQGHCAAGLGIPEQRIEMDIGDAILSLGIKPVDPARLLWRAVKNLDLAPSRMKLAALEASKGGLAHLTDKHRRLSVLLDKFRGNYDVVVIDCAPSIGLLTYNALSASDMVLVPVETSYFALQGATRQVHTVKTLSRKLGVQVPTWLFATMHEHANTVSADLLEELQRRFRDRVVPVVVRRDSRLREAASFGQTIFDYAPGSPGSEDYGKLGVWVAQNLSTKIPLPAEPASMHDTIVDLDAIEMSRKTPLQGSVPSAARPLSPDEFGTPYADIDHMPVAADFAASPVSHASTHANLPPPVVGGVAHEVKPLSRAEDVARRAQDFLKRLASGRKGEEKTPQGTSAFHRPIAPVARWGTPSHTAPHQTPGAAAFTEAKPLAPSTPTFEAAPFAPPTFAGTNPPPLPFEHGPSGSFSAPFTRTPGSPSHGALPENTSGVATFEPAAGPMAAHSAAHSAAHTATDARAFANLSTITARAATLTKPHFDPPTTWTPQIVRHLGVREAVGGVVFMQPLASGKAVSVAGSFNGWSSTTHVMRRNVTLGVYELLVPLLPGKVSYRVVIDGKWTSDPHNPSYEPNPFGEVNSVFYVTERRKNPNRA